MNLVRSDIRSSRIGLDWIVAFDCMGMNWIAVFGSKLTGRSSIINAL